MQAKKEQRAATAATANILTDSEVRRFRRLQSDFERFKNLLKLLDLGYPEAITAIDEYAGAYIASVQLGKTKSNPVAWREACEISNTMACVSGSWRAYAEQAMRMVMSEGDELGDVVPGDVVAGLRYVRLNLPSLYASLSKMDSSIGPCLPVSGSDFAAPAVLMRSALAASAA